MVERDRGFAALGREILDAARRRTPAIDVEAGRFAWKQCATCDERIGGGATYDLVLISYALGELLADVRARVLDAAWRATSADGALVIVEPGTPRHFQGVLDARTWLLTHGATIAAPCPHAAACPMAAAGDWCHFSARVPRTKEHRRLKAGSLSYEDEKFSYLIATRSPSSTPSPAIAFALANRATSVCRKGPHHADALHGRRDDRHHADRPSRSRSIQARAQSAMGRSVLKPSGER